ncbi:hypothetical protein BOTBODRAFT_485425 [Botryobasidium botryosum FD-172 SS1]|uniref:Uncharacterized protein n=1 Tax=Botryobasidium botryosum (strain FD-172 SS1) TaxID=930990 RepID=A0A067N5T8_BOTB1|nr:hypothetical protein BOTBODRAFT_485425 [Botryobasidium botryosum FD-172 SS1]
MIRSMQSLRAAQGHDTMVHEPQHHPKHGIGIVCCWTLKEESTQSVCHLQQCPACDTARLEQVRRCIVHHIIGHADGVGYDIAGREGTLCAHSPTPSNTIQGPSIDATGREGTLCTPSLATPDGPGTWSNTTAAAGTLRARASAVSDGDDPASEDPKGTAQTLCP